MKKSVFLAYAEDSDEDDAVVSHRQDDKSAKSSKQKQKQKAKKQEENALKSLAMTTSSKKSKKKKNQTHSTVAVDTVDEVVQAVEQVSVVDVPPSAVVAPASSYARASAALGTKNEAVGSPQSPSPVHAAQSSAPPPPPQKQPHTKQQPKPSSTPQRRQPTSSQVPTPPQAQQRDLPKKDKYIPPSLRNSTPAVPSPQPSQEHQWTSPERVDSPPPRSGPSLSGVTYVPAHITVILPGQVQQTCHSRSVTATSTLARSSA
ncbi:hypothetical protein, variant [Aphanomyces invadans]|uniref:Uncharacterized protein n=1 Tax=Aphanomyces invadans TaxID=157072 RepID=A0A024U4X9_9STRA|nr:hypothetical protein, variant [Aphanomyces invadans]ETW00688.1 hypothetical protein, variant [Aphanomyces invadans]|eukprot:XP_008870823.1 hypothetical protein, variant [Aphanomyces invadans]